MCFGFGCNGIISRIDIGIVLICKDILMLSWLVVREVMFEIYVILGGWNEMVCNWRFFNLVLVVWDGI